MAIVSHRDLKVFRRARDLAFEVFELTKGFPLEERFGMTQQFRNSSRSVAANIAEAWRKRRYKAMFVAKLSDAESEAAESQTWIELALMCGYCDEATYRRLDGEYESLIGSLVGMIDHANDWCNLPKVVKENRSPYGSPSWETVESESASTPPHPIQPPHPFQ